jgi:hypothetical protein
VRTHCRVFGTLGQSRKRSLARPHTLGTPTQFSELSALSRAGALLATGRSEHHMFRATALSIVLTLTVGPNASLLCRAWCDSNAGAWNECQHERSSATTRIAVDDDCDNAVFGVAAVLREDVRRDVPPPDSNRAIPVLRFQLVQTTIDARQGREPWRDWSLQERPLLTALRI